MWLKLRHNAKWKENMQIHFGTDYYPEHWPRERWTTDAELMQKMGLQVVRMAEFSWHKNGTLKKAVDSIMVR